MVSDFGKVNILELVENSKVVLKFSVKIFQMFISTFLGDSCEP